MSPILMATTSAVAASVIGSSQAADSASKPSKESTALGGGKNSAWLTAGIIIADVVGAGILGMPQAVASFGWLLGSVIIVLMLVANVHISILLWRVRMGCPACSSAHTYTELASGVFANSPPWQQKVAYGVTLVSQMMFLFGLMGVYLLSAGKGLGMVFYSQQVCLPIWMLIAGAILLPFALTAREMGSWQSLVWINIVTLTGTVVISLGYFISVGVDEVRPEGSEIVTVSSLTYAGVLNGLSTFTFGMTSQFMLTEIIAEMKDPTELPKAYAFISAPFQLVAFLLAGLGGYFFIGDAITGMLNENLPFGPTFQVTAGCLVIHMLISYLIKGVVFCKFFQTRLDGEYADSNDKRCRSWASWSTFVIPAFLAAFVLANLVPFFVQAVDLLGASLTPLSCWVVPIVLFMRWYVDTPEENRPPVSKFEWAIMALEMLFALVLMGLGTVSSVETIVAEWHTFGMPFACHCEGIWDTCACSAAHVGIAEICNATGL